jgi:peptidoglycan/LPS O-acetylase OafA/YrhL
MADRDPRIEALVAFLIGAQLCLAAQAPSEASPWTERWSPTTRRVGTQMIAGIGLIVACFLCSYPIAGNDPPATSTLYRPVHDLLYPIIAGPALPHTLYNLAAVLFLLAIPSLPILLRIAETRPLVAVGELSLMLYLTHDLLQAALAAPVFRYRIETGGQSYLAASLVAFAVYWPAALALAWLLVLVVERPNVRFVNWIQGVLVVDRAVAAHVGCARLMHRQGDSRSYRTGTSRSRWTMSRSSLRRRPTWGSAHCMHECMPDRPMGDSPGS